MSFEDFERRTLRAPGAEERVRAEEARLRPAPPASRETSTCWALAMLAWVVIGFVVALPLVLTWSARVIVPWAVIGLFILWRSLVS